MQPASTSDLHAVMYHITSEIDGRHNDACFYCILNGSLRLEVQNQIFDMKKEDIFYIPPCENYRLRPKAPSLLMMITFHPCFLLENLGFQWENIRCNSVLYPTPDKLFIISQMAALTTAIYTRETADRNFIMAKAHELLHYIAVNFIPKQKTPDKSGIKNPVRYDELTAAIQNYMAQNYRNTLSLTDTADTFGYTPPYMSSFFKKAFGVTFQEYLTRLRTCAAELYLTYSTYSPSKISVLCGFPNLPALVSAMKKKHGQTPEEFMAFHRITDPSMFTGSFESVTNKALILDYLFNYTNYQTESIETSDQRRTDIINVDTVIHAPMTLHWNYLINLGNAADFEKPAFRQHLKKMQDELSFVYGRFSGIFCLAGVCRIGHEKVYDFSRIFRITDFLKNIHILPMIELGNKPFHIYKEDEHDTTDYETFSNPAVYDPLLEDMLPDFLKACISRYGIDEVSRWKFELWLRYNPALTSIEPFNAYLDRFQTIAGIIKSLLPDACIGGPGFNTFLDADFVNPLLDAWSGRPLMPDFFTAYCFPYVPEKPGTGTEPSGYKITPAPDTMYKKSRQLRTNLDKHNFKDVPVYITEYSAFIPEGNYINDSIYPALYILYQTLNLRNSVFACGYWLVSDLSLEYKNPSAPFFGGSGIISKHGIQKPAYYAFKFLKMLGKHLIDCSSNYIITRSDSGAYYILVYDIGSLNPHFSADYESSRPLYYTYSAFESTLSLELTFNLTHLPSGTYHIRELRLDQNHGSALNVWRQLNYEKDLQPEDIKYIAHQSLPWISCSTEKITDTFCLHTVLNYNEIVMYALLPKY